MDRKKKGIRKCKDCGDHNHGCFGSGRPDGYGYDHCIIKKDISMTKKPTKLDDEFDFGFTLTDIKDVDEVKEAIVGTAMAADEWKNKADELKKLADEYQDSAEEWRDRAYDIFNAIEPLLSNLMKDKKDYIHWPHEVRIKKIEEFKQKLTDILEA